jgi:hypothetical protein
VEKALVAKFPNHKYSKIYKQNPTSDEAYEGLTQLLYLKTGVTLEDVQDMNDIIWKDGFFNSTKEEYWDLIK